MATPKESSEAGIHSRGLLRLPPQQARRNQPRQPHMSSRTTDTGDTSGRKPNSETILKILLRSALRADDQAACDRLVAAANAAHDRCLETPGTEWVTKMWPICRDVISKLKGVSNATSLRGYLDSCKALFEQAHARVLDAIAKRPPHKGSTKTDAETHSYVTYYVGSQQMTSRTHQEHALTLYHVHLALGDIGRYMAATEAPPDPTQHIDAAAFARHHYKLAARVCPSQGRPYNQLGVMSAQAQNVFSALFYFGMAMCAKRSVESAQEQLGVLYDKLLRKVTSQRAEQAAKQHDAREEQFEHWRVNARACGVQTSSGRAAKTSSPSAVKAMYFALCGMIARKVGTSQFDVVISQLRENLVTTWPCLDLETRVQMVMHLLYVVMRIHRREDANEQAILQRLLRRLVAVVSQAVASFCYERPEDELPLVALTLACCAVADIPAPALLPCANRVIRESLNSSSPSCSSLDDIADSLEAELANTFVPQPRHYWLRSIVSAKQFWQATASVFSPRCTVTEQGHSVGLDALARFEVIVAAQLATKAGVLTWDQDSQSVVLPHGFETSTSGSGLDKLAYGQGSQHAQEDKDEDSSAMDVDMRAIVLDTNCLLHQDKDKEAGLSEAKLFRLTKLCRVQVLVPTIVLAELRGISSDADQERSSRAKRVLDTLCTKGSPARCITSLGNMIAADAGLSETGTRVTGMNNDGLVVQSCSGYEHNNFSSGQVRHVVLVTDDRNLRLQANAQGVPAISLRDILVLLQRCLPDEE